MASEDILVVGKMWWDEDSDKEPEVIGSLLLEFKVAWLREILAELVKIDNRISADNLKILAALIGLWEQREFEVRKVG